MARRKKKTVRGPRFLRRQFPQVREVFDSRKAVEIEVQAHDAVIGKEKQPTECALARAAKRQYQADGAIIGMNYSYIIKGARAVRFHTPVTVQREITSFDRHRDFAPGRYKLSPVSRSQSLGVERREPHSGGRTEHRVVHKQTARVREVGT